MKLSIVIPAHNEEENIVSVLNKIEQNIDIPHELVVVNDHSSDDTARFVQEFSGRNRNIRLVENNLEAGFANAIRTGFANASGELVIPVMADSCDDLSTIKKMHEKMNEGFDVVCGARYAKGGARLGGSRLKAFFSSYIGLSLYYLLGLPTQDITNAFKMYRKKVLDSIAIESQGFEISMEIPLKAYYLGFRITDVPTAWTERNKGKSNFKIFNLFPNYLKLYLWAIRRRLTR